MFHCVSMGNEHENKTLLYDLEEGDVSCNQPKTKGIRKENSHEP